MLRTTGSIVLACVLLAPGSLQAQMRKGGGPPMRGMMGAGRSQGQGAMAGASSQYQQKKCQGGAGQSSQMAASSTGAAPVNAAAITALLQQATALLGPLVSQLQGLPLNNPAMRALGNDVKMMKQLASSNTMPAAQKQAAALKLLQKSAADLQQLMSSQNLPVSAQFVLAGASHTAQQLGEMARQATSP